MVEWYWDKKQKSSNKKNEKSNNIEANLSHQNLQEKMKGYHMPIGSHFFMEAKDKFPIWKICLTGGPCAGKTTSIAHISEYLSQRGFRVFVVPETPTMTMLGGGIIIMGCLSSEQIIKFQTYLMKIQMHLEDYFTELAMQYGEKAVVLCDRGVMDPCAYINSEQWQTILDENSWNTEELRDKRYDSVIHLVTAADGAKEFYTKENNQARYEDAETAIKVDERIRKAWIGHNSFVLVDNSMPGFQNKINKVLSAVLKVINLPQPEQLVRKFIVETTDSIPQNMIQTKFNVEEIFLKGGEEGKQRKLSKVGQGNTSSFFIATRKIGLKTFHEEKKKIGAREYLDLRSQIDEKCRILTKERTTFIWETKYYVLDCIKIAKEEKNLYLLKTEANDIKSGVSIPAFIKVIKEVTDSEEFASYSLAKPK